MRENLYRGKHIHATSENKHLDGRWIEGYLSDENYINSPELEGEFLVDSETVCQYTGLTDKNGRKIFEGDIIRKMINVYKLGQSEPCGNRIFVGVVVWDNSSSLYPGHWCVKGKDEYGNDSAVIFDNKYEVIGNIFDNVDLIEGGAR